MAVQIPLKAKYRSASKGRYSGGERPAPRKHRKKLNDAQKRNLPPQPVIHLVVDGLTGRSVFVRMGSNV